ncbi:MAG TPA: SBBP repeat-containing protein [Kofleriaceae bacterium]|nr:SBBP repeat-containing protein [Kofleriaceae bacterium]
MNRSICLWLALLGCGNAPGADSDPDARGDGDAAIDPDAGSDAGPISSLQTFVTYLGGDAFEQARDVTVDGQGNIIVVGGTQSANFPTTAGAYDTTFDTSAGGQLGGGGRMDVFVTKFSPTGALLWSTFIGGPSYDRAYGVEVDAAGDIYIAGRAGVGFPTTAGVLQPTFGGDVAANGLYGPQDGFVAKLSTDGTTLLWSTYFGGDDRDFIRDLDLDSTGIYVGVGELTRPHPYVTPGAFDTTRSSGYDVVVAKLALDGTSVQWATYFGGSGVDGVPSVRSGPNHTVYLIGSTTSTDLPTTAGAHQTGKAANEDFYVAKFTAAGDALVYCTYVGGNGIESHETHHGVVDSAGQVILGFYTQSSDLPTTAGAISASRTGVADAYVVKLAADGGSLVAATYLGGNAGEDVQGLAVDASGRIYVGGSSQSSDLPVTAGSFQATSGGSGESFVAWLSPDLTTVEYLTYLGGSGSEAQRSLWIDAGGNAISVGQTTSPSIGTTAGAVQMTYGGMTDSYVGAFKLH